MNREFLYNLITNKTLPKNCTTVMFNSMFPLANNVT